MDWLANITLPYILAAVAVLAIARFCLGKYKSSMAKQASEITESLLIAVVLVFLVIRPFIVQAFYIPSGSMLPTLYIRDHLLVNKFIYRFSEPKHGDIVVFKSPPGVSNDGQERDFIKRLMGVPGDVIQVKKGGVYRNGKRLKEPYLLEPQIMYEMPPVKVPVGRLFVMGDNRNSSNDSHVWGTLDRNRVLGKALVRFWPLDRLGIPR